MSSSILFHISTVPYKLFHIHVSKPVTTTEHKSSTLDMGQASQLHLFIKRGTKVILSTGIGQ